MESTGADVAMKDPGPAEDRRKHRRLAIRLPVECCPKGESRERAMRAVTSNISTGGVYFEADVQEAGGRTVSAPFGEADLLELEMTIPPG